MYVNANFIDNQDKQCVWLKLNNRKFVHIHFVLKFTLKLYTYSPPLKMNLDALLTKIPDLIVISPSFIRYFESDIINSYNFSFFIAILKDSTRKCVRRKLVSSYVIRIRSVLGFHQEKTCKWSRFLALHHLRKFRGFPILDFVLCCKRCWKWDHENSMSKRKLSQGYANSMMYWMDLQCIIIQSRFLKSVN